MKKLLCLLLLLAVFGPAQSQTWQLLSSNNQPSYRHSDSSLISQELRVLSTGTDNSDSVFHLNPIVLFCDTCSELACLRNQGQMLQKNMLLRPNGETVLMGQRTYLVQTQAEPGASWLFDTLNNITATVVSKLSAPVLGQTDSIKEIELSSGQAILLSRKHGLVSWPDLEQSGTFELVGIKNKSLGQWSPAWQEFYDFAVGDVFQHTGQYTIDPGTPNMAFTYRKTRILDKWWEQDTLIYKVERRAKTQYWGPLIGVVRDTFIQKYHPALITAWSESWPGQLQRLTTISSSIGFDSVYTTARLIQAPMFGTSKIIGGNLRGSQELPGCFIYNNISTDQPDLMTCDPCIQFYERLSLGLGLTSHSLGCFEYFEYDDLTAFVKNGDTTGVLLPESFFSAVFAPTAVSQIAVSPNPGNLYWEVQYQPEQFPCVAVVYDVYGKEVSRLTWSEGQSRAVVDASELQPGIYLLDIREKAKRGLAKLLKQ